MSSPYSDLDVMDRLPVTGDEILVVVKDPESGLVRDTERLPWEVMRTAWVERMQGVPSSPSFGQGLPFTIASDSEYLFFRNGVQWGRIPYTADNWSDGYNRLLRPVAPSLSEAPVGAPDGHYFYNSSLGAVQFKQGGSYVSLQPPQSFRTVSDGVNSATADQVGNLMFRSSDASVTVEVSANHITYGDSIDLKVNAASIPVGTFADDGVYAAYDHNHAGVYAPVVHDHDGVYAPVVHDHDGVYASISHNHTGVYAPLVHTHSASDITEGTFDNARISAGSVTQHAGSINHDALLNYSADRHVDHSTVSILTPSNSGLSGGGNLTASRSLSLDFMNVPVLSSPNLAEDSTLIYSASAQGIRRVLLSTLGFDVANHTHTASQIVSGTLSSARGGLGANASTWTGMVKMVAGTAYVATAGTDYAAVSHTHTASQITDFSSAVTAVTGDLSILPGLVSDSHSQNTDEGTSSPYFQLDRASNGGRMTWASSEMQVRNHDSSTLAPLRTGSLFAMGEDVELGDPVPLINAASTGASGNANSGFNIKLFDSDNVTRRDAGIRYDVSSRRFQLIGFNPVSTSPATRTAAAVFSQNVGNGSSTSFNVNHGLNSSAVVVSVVEISSGEAVGVSWKIIDADNVEVSFGPNSVPGNASHRVTVVG